MYTSENTVPAQYVNYEIDTDNDKREKEKLDIEKLFDAFRFGTYCQHEAKARLVRAAFNDVVYSHSTRTIEGIAAVAQSRGMNNVFTTIFKELNIRLGHYASYCLATGIAIESQGTPPPLKVKTKGGVKMVEFTDAALLDGRKAVRQAAWKSINEKAIPCQYPVKIGKGEIGGNAECDKAIDQLKKLAVKAISLASEYVEADNAYALNAIGKGILEKMNEQIPECLTEKDMAVLGNAAGFNGRPKVIIL